MRDPIGLLLNAARVDPVLRQAANAVEAELIELRALRDAIPGDDKLAVIRYCIEFTRADHHCFAAHSTSNEWLKWDARRAALWDACPPSVRAALRSNGNES